MSLSLNKTRMNGRAKKALPAVLAMRYLSSEEVIAHSAREAGEVAPPLQRVTERHRQLAQLLAQGVSVGVAAVKMGYSASRASILKSDPTFQELIAMYKAELQAANNGMGERLGLVGAMALDELAERVEEDPDSFTNEELMHLGKLSADRTGFGPSRTEQKNVNFSFGDKLIEARKRVMEAVEEAQVVEVLPERVEVAE